MKYWLLVPLLVLIACAEDALGEWDIDVEDVSTSIMTYYAGQEVLLKVSCGEYGIRMALHTDIHSDYRDVAHPVTIRFDSNDPLEQEWHYWHFAESGYYKTSIVADDPNVFISQLLEANRLTLHFAVTEADSVPATWNDVGGFAIAYEAVERECGFLAN